MCPTEYELYGLLDFDLVITSEEETTDDSDKLRYYSGALSPKVDTEIIKFANTHSIFRPLVMLFKLWKRTLNCRVVPSSYASVQWVFMFLIRERTDISFEYNILNRMNLTIVLS